MRGRGHRLAAALLSLTLLAGLTAPAQAAEKLRLNWEQDGNSVELTLQGLEGESVYGVQLQMIVDGAYTAAFTPAARGAYSPECRVSSSNQKTRITLYVTSQKPLNNGGKLPVGGLTLSGGFTMPSTATVTLLGHELRPLAIADGTAIPTEVWTGDNDSDDDDHHGSSGGGGGGGGYSRPAKYQIQVSSTQNGTVKSDCASASAKTLVTLTTTPAEGFSLEELTVTPAKGEKLVLTDAGDGKYTFRMPAANVEVSAKFRQTEPTRPPMAFVDVSESDWFHDAAKFIYEKGMMSGTAANAFSPNAATTRGMLVTILYRMEGQPEAAQSSFSDVPREMYYAKAVDWASQNGIVTGYGGNETGTFGPDNSVTREQMAAILYRYSAKKGKDVTARGDLSGFTDQAAISAYAQEAVTWAVGMGLVSGMGDGTVAPTGSATRAQVATILMRYLEKTEAKG